MIAHSLSVAAILALFTLVSEANAEKRIALVVGNSAYQNVAPLDNPKNDASLMAHTLKELGFTLIGDGAQLNLDKAGLDKAVQNFGQQLQGADVALFYYAGHGVQVRGSNYLVPVNANPAREADVDFQMVDVGLVLRQMGGSGTRLNLVILDACRNNPFGGRGLRGSEGGLAQMRAPEGTLISYATQPGNVAQDGADGNSPYTKALAATIRRTGLDIFQTFNEVGLTVKHVTGGAQQPWVSSSPIDGNFYFAGPPASNKSDLGINHTQDEKSGKPSDPLRLDLVTDCDRFAASPLDPSRPRKIDGVATEKVDIVAALSACRESMREFPDVARFAYQAGRVASIQKDYIRARRLYEQAASLGSAAGMNNLGVLYDQGNGVAKDPAEARKWYEIAAKGGVSVGLTNIGSVFLHGDGVVKDPVEARKWFERAAAASEPKAMLELGYLYESGNGVQTDYAAARKWYGKAADAGSAIALTSIGNLFLSGRGTAKDPVEARKWIERAAAAREPKAMLELGYLYESGIGVRVDFAAARSWYGKAADAGSAFALTYIGNLFLNGRGTAKDPVEARKWFERAATMGEPGAMNNLGVIYQIGNGVPVNYLEAHKWFDKSASLGHVRAMDNLGKVYQSGTGVAVNFSEARKWYEKGAAFGDAMCMRHLGYLYDQGLGVTKDAAVARQWNEKATAAEHDNASTVPKRLDSSKQ
jgi:TPR repeat protein